MEYALVKDGVVVQVIVADAAFIAANGTKARANSGFSEGIWIQVPEGVKIGIGRLHNGVAFVD